MINIQRLLKSGFLKGKENKIIKRFLDEETQTEYVTTGKVAYCGGEDCMTLTDEGFTSLISEDANYDNCSERAFEVVKELDELPEEALKYTYLTEEPNGLAIFSKVMGEKYVYIDKKYLKCIDVSTCFFSLITLFDGRQMLKARDNDSEERMFVPTVDPVGVAEEYYLK